MRSDIGRTVLWSRRNAGQTLSGAVHSSSMMYTSSVAPGTVGMVHLKRGREGGREGGREEEREGGREGGREGEREGGWRKEVSLL